MIIITYNKFKNKGKIKRYIIYCEGLNFSMREIISQKKNISVIALFACSSCIITICTIEVEKYSGLTQIMLLLLAFLSGIVLPENWIDEKRKEINIRKLIGASNFHIKKMLIKQWMMIAVFSIPVGFTIAYVLLRILNNDLVLLNVEKVFFGSLLIGLFLLINFIIIFFSANKIKSKPTNKIIYYIFFSIQLFIAIFVMLRSMELINRISINFKTAEAIEGNAYYLVDETDNMQIKNMIKDKKTLDRLNELYQFIIDSGVEHYIVCSYITFEKVGDVNINQCFADKKFFEKYLFSVEEGRYFLEEDFSSKEVVPVIIGAELESKYEVGKEYIIADSVTGEDKAVIVIGRLIPNQCYLNIASMENCFNLDYTIIIPIDDNEIVKRNDFSMYDMVINKMIFFTENPEEVNKICQKSQELDLFKLRICGMKESISKQFIQYRDYLIEQLFCALMTLVIVWINVGK